MTEVEALRAMTYEQRVAALDVAEIGIRMTVDVITEALMVPCDLLLWQMQLRPSLSIWTR